MNLIKAVTEEMMVYVQMEIACQFPEDVMMRGGDTTDGRTDGQADCGCDK